MFQIRLIQNTHHIISIQNLLHYHPNIGIWYIVDLTLYHIWRIPFSTRNWWIVLKWNSVLSSKQKFEYTWASTQRNKFCSYTRYLRSFRQTRLRHDFKWMRSFTEKALIVYWRNKHALMSKYVLDWTLSLSDLFFYPNSIQNNFHCNAQANNTVSRGRWIQVGLLLLANALLSSNHLPQVYFQQWIREKWLCLRILSCYSQANEETGQIFEVQNTRWHIHVCIVVRRHIYRFILFPIFSLHYSSWLYSVEIIWAVVFSTYAFSCTILKSETSIGKSKYRNIIHLFVIKHHTGYTVPVHTRKKLMNIWRTIFRN